MFAVFKQRSMLRDKISLPLSPICTHIFTAATTLAIYETAKMTEEGQVEWLQLPPNTLIILHLWSFRHVSLCPSFLLPFFFHRPLFCPISSPLHTNLIFFFLSVLLLFMPTSSAPPHQFWEKRGRVQSYHGNNKLAAGHLLSDFQWKKMMDIHLNQIIFTVRKKILQMN